MSESRIQSQVRAILSHREADTRVWRNNVGGGKLENGQYMKWGLQVGSSDLIGIHRKLITVDDVGTYIGRFFGVEIKTPVGRLSREQKVWIETIQSFGGIAEVCRSKEDAEVLLKRLS